MSSVLVPLLVLAVVAWLGAWVYADAREQESVGHPVEFSVGPFAVTTPAAWLLGCVVAFVVFLPLYLSCRNGKVR